MRKRDIENFVILLNNPSGKSNQATSFQRNQLDLLLLTLLGRSKTELKSRTEVYVLIGADEEIEQIYCKLYPAAILSPRSRPFSAIF